MQFIGGTLDMLVVQSWSLGIEVQSKVNYECDADALRAKQIVELTSNKEAVYGQ